MDRVNTAAAVVGYPVLLLIVLITAWVGVLIFRDVTKLFREMRYDRKKCKDADREWDNIRSSWIMETQTDEHRAVDPGRLDTDVMPFTTDQLFNYQEDIRNDRS